MNYYTTVHVSGDDDAKDEFNRQFTDNVQFKDITKECDAPLINYDLSLRESFNLIKMHASSNSIKFENIVPMEDNAGIGEKFKEWGSSDYTSLSVNTDGKSDTYEFLTPHTTPDKLLTEIVTQYPDLVFTTYCDNGINMCSMKIHGVGKELYTSMNEGYGSYEESFLNIYNIDEYIECVSCGSIILPHDTKETNTCKICGSTCFNERRRNKDA